MRRLPPTRREPHGRHVMAGEPLVFHCNFYNHWLQYVVLLSGGDEARQGIVDAAQGVAYNLLERAASELGLRTVEERLHLAVDMFAELGFGLLDLSATGPGGGEVKVPVSHYGMAAAGVAPWPVRTPESLWDAGYAAASLAVAQQVPVGTYRPYITACHSQGARLGRIELRREEGLLAVFVPGRGPRTAVSPVPAAESGVDELAIRESIEQLPLVGNEEGLIPRFGVALTHHLAGFYDRISFDALERADQAGTLEAAENLLVDAGYRCAFHTFSGVMESAEWEALVRPMCKTDEDWVHGMVAVLNTLGWGLWRVLELGRDRAVFRIYDDYESTGWLGSHGVARRPVSYTAQGAAAGLMNLVRVGRVQDGVVLDATHYERVFESPASFRGRHASSLACGDPWTEIVVTR